MKNNNPNIVVEISDEEFKRIQELVKNEQIDIAQSNFGLIGIGLDSKESLDSRNAYQIKIFARRGAFLCWLENNNNKSIELSYLYSDIVSMSREQFFTSLKQQVYNSLVSDIKIDEWLKEHLPDEIQKDLLLVSDRVEEEGSPEYLTVYIYPKMGSLLADLPEQEWSKGGFYLEKDDFIDGDGISLEYIISDHSNEENKSYHPQDVYEGLGNMVTELKKIYAHNSVKP